MTELLNIKTRAINAIAIAEPIDSAVDWYIDNDGDINAAHQTNPISTEERLAVIAHAIAADVINLLYLLETEKSRLSDLENGRPMETAPRDGTQILVEVICDDFVYLDLVVWHDGKWVGNADNYFELDGRWWPLPGRQE